MEEIRGPAGRNMWEKLSNVQEDVLASYLKNEYPQTIAVVLSQDRHRPRQPRPRHPPRGTRDGRGSSACSRSIRCRRKSSKRSRRRCAPNSCRRCPIPSAATAHEQMAEIFNSFDRQTEARFITSLEENDREGAERIKALMFTFEDLGRLDASAQALLAKVDKKELALALKGANDTVKDFFFANMSARSGKLLKDDMEAMGPVRLKDVDEAQALLVDRQGHGRPRRDRPHQEPRRRPDGRMMAEPAKFRFDPDLAAPDKTRERAATAAEIARKRSRRPRARAYRASYEAAQHEARVESDRRAALALEEIGITIRGIATQFSGIEARIGDRQQ